MDVRKKVARYSLLSTIMQGITILLVVGLLITMVVLMCYLTGFIGDSIESTKNVNPDDVTAGWMVLFGSVGGLFGVFAGIVLIVAMILLIGPIIAGIIVLIYGIRTYKKRNTSDFKRMIKNDSIIKLVLNAVIVIMSLLTMPSSDSTKAFVSQLDEMVGTVLFALPSIVSVIVSILALLNVKYLEELPEESERQYIEYHEDNSSYFGQ